MTKSKIYWKKEKNFVCKNSISFWLHKIKKSPLTCCLEPPAQREVYEKVNAAVHLEDKEYKHWFPSKKSFKGLIVNVDENQI